MSKYIVLYNPLADNGRGEQNARKLESIMQGNELEFSDITKIESYRQFFEKYDQDMHLVIAGGDGTLNHFINGDAVGNRQILYYPSGSGNDFFRDVGDIGQGKPFLLNPFLANLPEVTVQGKTRRFINGIGFGIDGYCCEEGDIRREKSNKRVNYTAIALKGLFYDYHPRTAKVTVDGEKHEFHKVWMAPTMNGRFFGGGMMVTPNQDRLNPKKTVTLMLAHDLSRLKILRMFPLIFKGTHVQSEDVIGIFEGHEITVEYDIPCALQIDGETVTDVVGYSVKS